MNVVHFSTYGSGGAGIAALRIHRGLLAAGTPSTMRVRAGGDCEPGVLRDSGLSGQAARFMPYADRLPLFWYPRRPRQWGVGWITTTFERDLARLRPDIVHLHWVSNGFLSVGAPPRLGRPLVWTLHDMWPFTGGCHYDEGCGRWESGCGACPLLGSHAERDVSWRTLDRKLREWTDMSLAVVSPSRWLADAARRSAVFRSRRVEVIPNGIDLEQFRPHRSEGLRAALGLEAHKRVILFGADRGTSDPRKGSDLLMEALGQLEKDGWASRAQVAVLGSGPRTGRIGAFEAHWLGAVRRESELARIYSAADVFVAPSIQENLSNMMLEATACGTPCVAFSVGGMPDIVEHEVSGYLAEPFDPTGIARGIAWVFEDKVRHEQLSARARTLAEERFDIRKTAARYAELYAEVIGGTRPDSPR